MDNVASTNKIQQILTNLKRIYFNDYQLIFMFSFTLTQDDLLLYRAFNQRKFQYKLLTLSSKCNLEKDLQTDSLQHIQKNLEVETQDYTVTGHEFLNAMVDILEDNTIFELPPILEEQRWLCFQPPLVDYPQQRFFLYLAKPIQD